MPLTERAEERSAFISPDAFLNYRVMAFRMKNAPSSFQQLINTVLAGVPNCEMYLDDVVLYNCTWLKHVDLLRQVCFFTSTFVFYCSYTFFCFCNIIYSKHFSVVPEVVIALDSEKAFD